MLHSPRYLPFLEVLWKFVELFTGKHGFWARPLTRHSASSFSFVIMTSVLDQTRCAFYSSAIKPLSAGTNLPLPPTQCSWGLEIFRAAEINKRGTLKTDNYSEPPLTLAGNAED